MSDLERPGPAPGMRVAGPIRVGAWLVEPSLHRISEGPVSVHLEPRVMRLLVHLAGAEGRVVSRAELLDEVWDGAVVNDEAVSRAVSELRKALGDDRKEPRYVETIPKSGYRLVAPISFAAGRAPGDGHASGRARRVATTVALAGLVAALGLWAWRDRGSEPGEAAARSAVAAPLTAQPLTAYPGREIDPAIDGPGERVVFAWNGGAGGDEYDLYVRRVGAGGEPERLTAQPGFEGHPCWSPDGASVAFVRATEEGAAVWVVPGQGGEERRLFDLETWSFGLDWFPDGRSLVVAQPREDGVVRLLRLALDSPEARELTTPDPRLEGDYRPAVSPDGRWVAFVRAHHVGQQDVWVVDTENGEERRLSDSGGRIRGVDWGPDGRHVVYASDLGGGFGLWRADIDSRRGEWLPLNGQDLYNPVVASTGRIVFEQISYQENLWEADLAGDPAASGARRLGVRSTRRETSPALSPDGSRLAFVSNRTGRPSLWLSSGEGSDPRPLTRSDEAVASGPVWSPDGRRLAAGLVTGGFSRPVVLDVESGRSRTLLDEPSHAFPVAWGGDGARLYFTSDRGGRWDLWALAVDAGRLERLTTEGGFAAAESATGDTLFFTRLGDPAFYALALRPDPAAASGARRIGTTVPGRLLHWRLAAGGIFFATRQGEDFHLARLDPATGATAGVGQPPGLHDGAFAVSVDGERLIYSRIEESESDLGVLDGVL